MPLDLTEDEHRALVELLRRTLDLDPYPHAPRLDPLKAILAKLDPMLPQPERLPPSLTAGVGPTSGGGNRGRKHPLDYAIAVFVVLTALATGFAACYTRRQWLTMDDTEKRQLRAYVIVSSARFAKDESGNIKYGVVSASGAKELMIYYDVSNEGTTPAYDVHRVIGISEPFVHKTLEFNYTDGTAAYLSKKQTFGPVRTTGLFQNQIDEIMSGKAPLVFAGQITYRDIFDNTWPTNFCFKYAPRPVDPAFGYCSRWSASDKLNYAR
jgi:hypothetical protein